MTFVDFCRAHGLLIDSTPPPGIWKRYPTTDHPRKRNGSVKYLGTHGFVCNHATDGGVVDTWRPDAQAVTPDMERIAEQAQAYERKKAAGHERAAARAAEMLRMAVPMDKHGYLIRKGLADERALVLGDDSLIVPMRHWSTNKLMGAQLIAWDADTRQWTKKMLPGMRAKGAVLRLGPARVRETWLCEGYATALSLMRALAHMRMSAAVVVCFSDGNLVHVAEQLTGARLVFADNDISQAGERAAVRTGLPWCMADEVGYDANDLHVKRGLMAVCAKVMHARAMEPVP